MKKGNVLKSVFLSVGLFIAIILLYLLLWPVNIDPAAWTPPDAPELTGVYAENNRLGGVEKLAEGCIAPEAIAIDESGYLYTGLLSDGRILRISPDGSVVETFAQAGVPAGLKFDAVGNLVVADGKLGLISVDRSGNITVLADQVDGLPIRFADDLVIASDGKIYFTEASTKFGYDEVMADFFEHRPNGRLLVYDPVQGEARELLDQLYFANGVALSPGEDFLLINETSRYRISRYWLSGERAGTVDVFAENLPGFPDNITFNGYDTYWVALAGGPKARAGSDPILSKPFLRKVIWRLPGFMRPASQAEGYILALDLDGNVRLTLQDPTGETYPHTTSAIEYGGMLYLGSHKTDGIGRIPVTW